MPSKSSNYDCLKDNQVEDSQNLYYKAPIAELIDETSSLNVSPTYSTMKPQKFSTINVISNSFETNEDYLRQNFNSTKNLVKREGFFHTLI